MQLLQIRRLAAMVMLVFVVVACGGGSADSDEPDSATSSTVGAVAATDPTTAPTAAAPGPTADWCTSSGDDGLTVPDLADATDLQARAEEYLAGIDQAVASAPVEIRSDVETLAEAGREFFALLAEYDWQFLDIPLDDERFIGFDDGSIVAASERIAEYCGFEPDPAAGSGIESDPVPDDFPEELLPPGEIVFVTDMGPGGVLFGMDGDFEEIVAFYGDLLDAEASPSGVDSVVFQATYNGTDYIIAIGMGDPVFVTVAHF